MAPGVPDQFQEGTLDVEHRLLHASGNLRELNRRPAASFALAA